MTEHERMEALIDALDYVERNFDDDDAQVLTMLLPLADRFDLHMMNGKVEVELVLSGRTFHVGSDGNWSPCPIRLLTTMVVAGRMRAAGVGRG